MRLNRDQSREAVLCDQLIPTTEIAYEVPADTVRACHQQIDEVVDHDRHLGTVDRLKPYQPLSGTNHVLYATEHVRAARTWDGSDELGSPLSRTTGRATKRSRRGSFPNTGSGERTPPTISTVSDSCAESEEMMRPYLDHVLTDEEMALAEAHLAECVDCRRRYRFEESLRVTLAGTPIRRSPRAAWVSVSLAAQRPQDGQMRRHSRYPTPMKAPSCPSVSFRNTCPPGGTGRSAPLGHSG
jgi:putative zinc finger protein